MENCNIRLSEISPKRIFEEMKLNVYNDFSLSPDLSVNKAYLYSRRSLFKILHAITNAMSFKSQTFFLCTHFLDIIFSSKKQINTNINLIGLASLCLSAKYCENDPIVPHLQYFLKAYNVITGYRSTFSMNDLKSAEIFALKSLNYKLNYYTSYDFNSFLFGHGILKMEQLKEIGIINKNQRYFKNKKNEFFINQNNSLIIKNLLEKIYRKSRYYLDIIVNKTKLCFKYNSLLISIYIMKKSVNEILAIEHKINSCEIKIREEFQKKNSIYFKEIMFDFYEIEYESNEEYKQLINDEEILEIFEKKSKDEPNFTKKIIGPNIEEKKDDEKDDEKENNKLNNNNNNDNRTFFASSVSNGFYKRLSLKINPDEINRRQNDIIERNPITSRVKKSITIDNDNTLDNVNINLNINELQNSHKKRNNQINNLTNTNKSSLNIYSSFKNKQNEKIPTGILKKKISNIPINNRYIPRIETYKNFNKKNILRNNNDSICTENTFQGSNYLNKKEEIKTENNSPGNLEKKENSINKYNNITNYSRITKVRRLNVLNNRKERKDFSYSITENNNNNELTAISCEKKPYYRKLIRQNTNEKYKSLNHNSISNNNINNVDKNKYETMNIESFSRNENNNLNIKANSFFTRINLRKDVNNKSNILNTSENVGNENTIRNNNNSNTKANNNTNANKEIITTSSRYRRRYQNNFHNNLQNKTNNNNISADNKTENSAIIKDDNNKKEIESYSQIKADNNNTKGLTSVNFYKSRRNKISVNTINNNENKNIESNKSFIESKRLTYLLGKQNTELNNTLKEINLAYARNKKEEKEKEKEREREKKSQKEKELEKEREREKEREKEREREKEKENKNNNIDNNNNNIKVNFTKSIRQKYLNINKSNRSSNNINKNTESAKENNNNNSKEFNTISTNSIPISIRNRYTSKTKLHAKDNIILTENNNNDNRNTIKENNTKDNNNITRDSKSKSKYSTSIPLPQDYINLKKTSIYRLMNRTKNLFNRNNNNNEEEENKQNINNENDKCDSKNTKNKPNIHFYRTLNNMNKIIKSDKNLELQRNKEEIKKNQQDIKIGNNSFLRNVIYKNKLNKNNISINSKSQKNTSNITLNNNNINSYNNNENKNKVNNNRNILNEYVKIKNIYVKNCPGVQINNSFVLSNNDTCSTTTNKKYNNRFIRYNNNGKEKDNGLIRYHRSRKAIDTNRNNNDNYKVIFNGK